MAFSLATDGGQYAVYDHRQGHPGMPLARVAVFLAAGWVWLLVLLPLAIGLLPDGQLSRRWRLVLRTYVVVSSLFLALYFWENLRGILARHITVDSTGGLTTLDSSHHGLESEATKVLAAIVMVVFLAAAARSRC